MKSGQIFFSVLILFIHSSFLSEVRCASNRVLQFDLQTVPKFELGPGFVSPHVHFYKTPEERKKLCYYAYLRANLAYIDYGYVPNWQDYLQDSASPPSLKEDQFLWGMYCSTVPTIYLLRRGRLENLQITFIESSSDLYSFDEDIIHAHSVSLAIVSDITEMEHSVTHPEEMELIDLSDKSGRRSLCAKAREHVMVDFLSSDVPEAFAYEFELVKDASEKFTTMAIACPTSPKLFLSHGSAEKRIKITIVKSEIDLYEFELDDARPTLVVPLTGAEQSWGQYMKNVVTHADKKSLSQEHLENDISLTRWNFNDRKNLCKIARRHRAAMPVPFVEDTVIKEAQLYAFQFSKERWERNVAIVCSELPRVYLRTGLSENRGPKIRITFVENPLDHYIHSVEVPKMPFTQIQASVELDESENHRFARHPFAKMSRENLWNYCSAAQRSLLDDEEANWNFRFTEQEPTAAANKLLLIPYYMNVMRMRGPTYHDGVRDGDLFINCSEWPQLYVRLGRSPREIISVLNKDEVLNVEGVKRP